MKQCTEQPESEENMKVVVIILLSIFMLLVTLGAMNYIATQDKKTVVGSTAVSNNITGMGCAGITVMAVAFDVVSLLIMAFVV